MAIQLTITAGHLRRLGMILLALVLIVLVALALWQVLEPDDPFAGQVDRSAYQAVTLDDGTIYFGKLSVAGERFYRLTDVHLIRTRPGEGKDAEPTNRVEPLSEQLLELENRLLIDREDLTTVANLPDDSAVSRAIRGRDDS